MSAAITQIPILMPESDQNLPTKEMTILEFQGDFEFVADDKSHQEMIDGGIFDSLTLGSLKQSKFGGKEAYEMIIGTH